MKSFSNSEGIQILYDLIKSIQANKQYLSDIDGQIGDGDHGINMSKGFTLCEEQLKNLENVNLSEGLSVLSKILMMKIGGSMGPLYGYYFKSMADRCNDKEEIDAQVFNEMIVAIPNNLSKITKAKPGDKTLMDCLLPAVEAYKDALINNKEFDEALDAMCESAQMGRDSTKELVSKVGRSSRLGERSKGVIDAGAASCSIILCSMATSIKKLIA